MGERRIDRAFGALVTLTALQVVLVYTVGGGHYEFVDAVGLLVLAVAFWRLAAGSFGAWVLLVVLNVLPIAVAIMVAVAPGSATLASGEVVLLATSAPLLAVLLSRPMRRRVRYARAAAPQAAHAPGRPTSR